MRRRERPERDSEGERQRPERDSEGERGRMRERERGILWSLQYHVNVFKQGYTV